MKGFKTEYEDLLPEPDPMLPEAAFRRVYPFLHIVWGISVLACPVFVFFNKAAGIYFIIMFLLVVISFVLSGLAFVRRPFSSFAHRGRFDTVVFSVLIVSCLLCGACFILGMIYGGGPELTEDGYAVISHNQIIRTISETEYRILSVSETLIFTAGLCIFTSASLLHARNKYAEMKKKESADAETK